LPNPTPETQFCGVATNENTAFHQPQVYPVQVVDGQVYVKVYNQTAQTIPQGGGVAE
jgi:hypothetical protein